MTDDSENEMKLEEIPLSVILDKIESGAPVEYHDAIIKSGLNIEAADLTRKHSSRDEFYKEYFDLRDELNIVKSIIKFDNCTFEGIINFNNTIFERKVSFERCKFNKYIHFKGCEFRGLTNFRGSRFNKFADFSYSEIGGAIFIGSIFSLGAHFMICRFNGAAYFNKSQFDSEINFFRCYFGNFSQFNGSKFEVADFSESTFGTTFGKIYFEDAKFNRMVNFSDSTLKADVSFNKAVFDKFVDFRRVKFEGSIDFGNSEFGKVADFRGSSFSDYLVLKYSDFTTLELPWNMIKGILLYDGSTYLALVKNYNSLELFEDADACYYQYRTLRRKEHLGRVQWAIDCMPWLFYGYGVRFYYPLIEMLGVLIISAGFYMHCGQAQFPGSLGLSAIILTTTTQVDILTGFCWDLSIIERISGWLLMATFLVALAKKTLR